MKYYLAALALLLVLLSACEIRKPVLPEWDVTLNIPLMNERFFVTDLVDSVNIMVGENDILTLHGSGEANTPPFGNVSFNPEVTAGPYNLLAGVPISNTLAIEDPEGNVQLYYGRIFSGNFSTLFENIHPSVSQLKISIPQVVTPQGNAYQIVYTGATGWEDHPLDDCEVGILNSGQQITELQYFITVVSTLPEGTPVGTLTLAMNQTLAFDVFQGHLNNYQLALEETATSITVDYPHDIEEAVELTEASLRILLTNEVGFAAEFHGSFYAVNTRTNEERSIPIVDEAGNWYITPPATAEEPGYAELVFTNNISQLLQIMPDRVEIRDAFFLVNSAGGPYGTVRSTDIISCDYQIDAPFKFILNDSMIRMKEPIEVDISSQNRNRIRDNALSAFLELKVLNMLPIGATATLYVAVSDTIDIADSLTYEFSRSFTVNSNTLSPDEQTLELSLSKTELDVFTNPKVYLLWTFSFESSQGEVITITASPADYIQVKSMMTARIRIREES